MKKTNIRINDHFLIKKNDQYFLSDITDQDQWINTDNLVNHKGKNVTSKLQELTEQYNINYNGYLIHKFLNETSSCKILILPYLGMALSDLIDETGSISIKECKYIIKQILYGLKELFIL